MAFENRRSGPGRGLRGLATRVSGTRGRQRGKVVVAGDVVDAAEAPGRPAVRPDPVLRWKNPSHPPEGDFTPCAVPNAQLKVHGIPDRGDSWDAVSSFSLSYDGYAYWDDVSELATRCIRAWTRDHTVPASIDEVRACLFFEQRRWHHFGEDPNGRGAQWVWALLDTLRSLVAARTASDLAPSPAAPPVTVTRAGGVKMARGIRSFLHDDAGYLAWIAHHRHGFVVNADRTLSPGSLVLHRASCASVGGAVGGGRTRTAHYRKVCAAELDTLVDWCRDDIGVDPRRCGHCRPPS